MSLFDFFRDRAGVGKLNVPVRTIPAHSFALWSMKRSVYSAAHLDRTTASWTTQPMSADQVIERNYRILVARSREQAANNDYARAFLRMCRQNIIGHTGITMQAQAVDSSGRLDNEVNDAVELAWWEWSKRENCDITGRQSLRSICNSCVTGLGKDGEFFALKVYGKEAGPWGFALQLVDPLRCAVDLNEDRLRNGHFIRQGIEFTHYGRPVAYYFTSLSADADLYTYQHAGKNYVRKPADEVLHVFEPLMIGQKRGLPWLATALYKMRHLNAFEEAALINARVGASKMGFVQWQDGFGPDREEEDGIPEIDAEPGVIETLPYGAEFKEWNPQYPNGEFQPFTKHMLRGIAAGLGVPYNELAADLEGVNFSSIRQGTLDSREHWKDCQELVIEAFMQPLFEAWLPVALLAGRIKVHGRPLPATRIERYATVEWQGRRWQWIDPRADVAAAVTSKNNMLTSQGAIIREQGKDPQTVRQEIARDIAAQIEAYVKEGISRETAESLVLLSMGMSRQTARKPEQNHEGDEK